MFEVVNGTATKYVVLYGYDLLDITMYIAITLSDCDKKVIVCDVTDEKIVYSCVKSSEGEMKPVTIGKVKYCAGYTDECADIKIVCGGFSGLFEFKDSLNMMVLGYTGGKMMEAKRFACNLPAFDLIVKGEKPASGPDVNVISFIDNVNGIHVNNVFEVGINNDASIRVEFFGITDHHLITKGFKEMLNYVAKECGIDAFSIHRVISGR